MAVPPSRSSVAPWRRLRRSFRGPRSRSFVFAGLLVCLVCAGALTGVTTARADSSPSASAAPLTLKIGYTSDADNLNPFVGYESPSYEVWALNYDKLGYNDAATLKDTPGLAESWTVSPDGKTWTFHIRQGVKWQDGQPLTAHDVAFTYNYIIDNQMTAYLASPPSMRSWR